jgi:hypothetical protein
VLTTAAFVQEEKERLLKEMETLKAQIEDLRSHKKVPFHETEAVLQKKYEAGKVLREGVQQRQQMFSQLSSIMSEYTLCVSSVGAGRACAKC